MEVTILQYDINWLNKSRNQDIIRDLLSKKDKTDLIVLPEMFTTGFITNGNISDIAENMNDSQTINWMLELSKEKDAAVTGSLVIKEDGNYYNRLIWAQPDGVIRHYDKKHLFSLAGEDLYYESGNKHLIVEWRGFKIKTLICYDLRFPVWSSYGEFDMIIYVANWPKTRSKHWNTLLKSRAIENQCYVVGVNRTGKDPNKNEYNGLSQIISPNGEIIEFLKGDNISSAYLEMGDLLKFRKKLPFLKDSDKFNII
jgi:predicted amidohydrolase